MAEQTLNFLENIDPDINFLNSALQLRPCRYFTLDEFNSANIVNNDFSLLNYNIRSFNRNKAVFETMLNYLKSTFKCIILTETWNTEQNLDLCFLENYQVFHTYRPRDHIYSVSGGISIFCLEPFKAEKLDNFSFCYSYIETCVIKITVNDVNMIIVGIYRPPQGNKSDFVGELYRILSSLADEPGVLAVAGDFNLNLQNMADSHTSELTSTFYSMGLVPIITKPTRFPNVDSNTLPSTLDHIWTDIFRIKSCGIIDFDCTDHLPCFAIYNLLTTKNNEKIRLETRPYSDANLQKLTDRLQNTDWNSLLNYNDLETCTTTFIDKLNYLYTECFPLKVKFISNKRMKNIWITRDIKRLINEKSETFKKYRRGEITREDNNIRKNYLNKKINKAKNNFYSNAFELYRNDAKRKWKLLSGLMGTNRKKNEIIEILDGENNLTETDDIINKFADFFSNVGRDLESQLPTNINLSPLTFVNRNPRSFYLFSATTDEVIKIISNLKITKTDKNYIPVNIFKSIKESIRHPLTKIINTSFSLGKFPDIFKLARITPIHKKNAKNLCSNYRPISSLPYLSKIFERLMTNRLVNFFHKFNLFNLHQFGFLKKKSTQDAILNFTEKIYDALNTKNHNLSILIDLKSAFDTVNHDLLLKKLELYGLRGPGLDWIRSYLTNRETYVALRQTPSTRHPFTIGIPQGSIIGPILFIIYINDLPNVSNRLSCTLFADDTNFNFTHENYNDMVTILNSELVKINDWTIANRLTINVDKTELLLFTNRDIGTQTDQITLNGNHVRFVGQARFLGVIIDNSLSYGSHVDLVIGKVSKHAGILYRLRTKLPISSRINYYNAFILPYLSYNVVHWGGTNACHLNPLITLQKRIIRTIAGKRFLDHTTPLFHNLNILKFHDLYKFHCVLDTRSKLLNGHYRTTHNLNTRNNKMAVPKFQRLTRTQQSLTYRGPTCWNDLPETIRNIDSLVQFKKAVKKYYIDMYS